MQKSIFKKYVKDKFKHNSEFIDLEARNTFKSKDVTPSVIKCAYRYNQYRVRDAMINGKLTGMECPRCNEDEMWDHVIKCRAVRHMQRQFIKNLVKELLKVNKRKVDEEIVLDMIEDIVVYFDNGDEEEYTTS